MSIILNLIAVLIMLIGGILVAIFGWGLTPQNWGWIIFGNLTTIVIAGFLQVAAKQLD
jgi:hypothetical protein